MSLAGKVAVITGGSSGIGEETARMFAAEGCKVMIAARRVANLEKIAGEITAAGGECAFVKCDVCELEEIKAMIVKTVEVYGKIDILFNNAGYESDTFYADPCGLPSMDDATIAKIANINMTAPVYCAKYAIEQMQKQGTGGVVIGNASVAAAMPMLFSAMVPLYHPTKCYMDAMTRGLAAAHAGSNIQCYNVNPLAIQTEMWTKIYEGVPAYVKPMLEEMGVTSAVKYAEVFNTQFAAPGADPVLKPDSVAKVALAFANGTTTYVSGDGVLIAPGGTYHISQLYDAMYGGPEAESSWYPGGNGPIKGGTDSIKDWAGVPMFPEKMAAAAAAAEAAAAPVAAAPTTTTTTTTTTTDGSTTTETVTVTSA